MKGKRGHNKRNNKTENQHIMDKKKRHKANNTIYLFITNTKMEQQT